MSEKTLVRIEGDKVIAGVCSGFGYYLGIDVTIVRILFLLSFLFINIFSVLIYVALWIILPAVPYPPIAPPPAISDPTGEWRYDPYTGEPIANEPSKRVH